MAFRSDITVDWALSPRIATVAAPSVALTIQDLYDTLQELAAQIPNMIYPAPVSAGGKEALSGGSFVAVTLTLLDTRLAFEAITASDSTGTATSADVSGTILTDLNATFQADGVLPGARIVNFDDFSEATVLEVLSETQLRCYALDDGTDDQWEIGDTYKIWNGVQCVVSGGNLVAEDGIGDPLDPIFKTANTQVVISQAAATAALDQDQVITATAREIEDAIYFDAVNGTAGVDDDNGTLTNPSNNVSDALDLLVSRSKSKIRLVTGTFALDRTGLSNVKFIGEISKDSATVDFNGFHVQEGAYDNVTMTGDAANSEVLAEGCSISGLTNAAGIFKHSALISLAGPSVASPLTLYQCFSGVSGSLLPTLDLVLGVDNDCQLRAYAGGILVSNVDQPDENLSVDLISGSVTLDSTNTDGTIIIRGVGTLADGTAGSVVIKSGFIGRNDFLDAIYFDTVNGTAGTTDSNGTQDNPSNNVADTLTLLAARRGHRIRIFEGTFVVDRAMAATAFVAEISDRTAVVDFNGFHVHDGYYENVELTGAADSSELLAEGCEINGLTDARGTFRNCSFFSLVSSVVPCTLVLFNCYSAVPGAGTATIDLRAGVTTHMAARAWAGGVTVSNMDDPGTNVSVDLIAGHLVLDATCTAGTLALRGVGKFTDNSTGLALDRSGFLTRPDLQEIESLVVAT